MFKCYICYDENNNPIWTVDIYKNPKNVYPDEKLYLTAMPVNVQPDFDTLMALLHSIYGCDIGTIM